MNRRRDQAGRERHELADRVRIGAAVHRESGRDAAGCEEFMANGWAVIAESERLENESTAA